MSENTIGFTFENHPNACVKKTASTQAHLTKLEK